MRNNKFEFIQRLGAGHFGEVWLVNDTNLDAEYALKCIPVEKISKEDDYFREARILKGAENLNIVKIMSADFLTDKVIYLAMEYVKKGSLEDETKGMFVHLSRAKKLMIDVLRGLSYSHQKGIIHRDIKPANILVGDKDEGKLSDFGLALSRADNLDSSSMKYYHYWMHLAPEVETFKDHTKISDIYACGVTLYRMVNGDSHLPLTQLPLENIQKEIRAGKFPDRKKYRDFIPRSLKLIINKAMNIDPSKRYQSADEMRHALEKIPLDFNWNEKRSRNGINWVTNHDGECFIVKRFFNDKKKWTVETKKGSSKKNARRIKRLCREKMNKTEAISYSRKILQNLTNGNDRGKRN